jgi:uncharacterized protein (DUF1015 family)
MSIFKPFKGFRPKQEFVHLIASRPYDVLDSNEARLEVKDNPYSFLHVVQKTLIYILILYIIKPNQIWIN